jgi:membrane-associated protein
MYSVASPLGPDHLLSSFGALGLAVILFAECGLLIGFFLPGDTLLFSAGLLLATGKLNTPLAVMVVVAPAAAIVGNVVGYWIGYRAGPRVFDRPDSRIFKPEYVERSHAFFDRFGWAAIVLARFVPVVRTVATVMAGASRMRFVTYLIASIVGGILWSDGVMLIAYWLGHLDFVQNHIAPYVDEIIVVAVLLTLLPTAIHYLQSRRRQRRIDGVTATTTSRTD